MKIVLAAFAAILVATSVVQGEKARFDNYRLYRIQIQSVQHLEVLQAIEKLGEGYSFWSEPVQLYSLTYLVVPPHKFAEFGEFVERYGLVAELSVTNLQTLFDDEQRRSKREGFGWEDYHTLDEIYAWLDELLVLYPDVLTPISAGTSHEGRPIRGVKLSYGTGNAGVIMEGTIHAREWISGATVTWILNELLTSADTQIRNIAENYDWHFFPIANPDGYEYTHTTNRAWRKTRKPHNILCVGADPNRNWDYKFMQGGASSNPCTDTFAGPEPFSEDETRGLSQYISSVASTVSTYLDFHAYSQLLMLPYGHSTEHLDNYDQMFEVATKAVDKLKERYGTEYKVGNIAEIIYVATGSSMDWVKGVYQTPIAFAYELRDTGRYGFVLPTDQIVPTAEETLDSVVVILEEGERLGLHQPYAEAAAREQAKHLER